jgi:hypothetical protein
MTKEFPDRLTNEMLWQNEQQAMDLLGRQPDEVVSIKVRPITADGWNAYVYGNEYDEIEAALGPANLRGTLGESWGRQDNAGQFRDGDNVFVVAEHETGPEIVAYLAVIAASLGLAEKVVGLTKTIIETVLKHSELKKAKIAATEKQESPGERFYVADGVSIEIRTKRGGKRIASFELAPGLHISETHLLTMLKAALVSLP